MNETWKSLKGLVEFGDNYEISEFGNIRNFKTKSLRKLQYDKDGYHIIRLYLGNNGRTHRVHRLVGLAFLNKGVDKNIINHKDGNKTNNHTSNLEWVTSSENNKHSWETKLRKPHDLKGEKHPQSKINDDIVREIRVKYSVGNTSYSKLAKEYNIDKSMVGNIINLKNWKHVV